MTGFPEYAEAAGETVLLRRLKDEDTSQLSELFDSPISEAQAQKLIESAAAAWQEGSEYLLAVVSREDGKLKGIIEMYGYTGEAIEIGYRIMPKERNRGYAKEAVCLLTRQLLKGTGIKEVHASAMKHNLPSVQLLRHNGFEQISEENGRLKFVRRREL